MRSIYPESSHYPANMDSGNLLGSGILRPALLIIQNPEFMSKPVSFH